MSWSVGWSDHVSAGKLCFNRPIEDDMNFKRERRIQRELTTTDNDDDDSNDAKDSNFDRDEIQSSSDKQNQSKGVGSKM